MVSFDWSSVVALVALGPPADAARTAGADRPRSPWSAGLLLCGALACGPDTPGAGCPEAGELADTDDCAAHTDEASCGSGCVWFESRLFTDCGGACGDSTQSGVCVKLASAPETGCTGPCAKFWRETPAGLQLFEADLCFEFPDGWAWCQLNERAECACGCEAPP